MSKFLLNLFKPRCMYCDRKVVLTPHGMCEHCFRLCYQATRPAYDEMANFGLEKIHHEAVHFIWMPSDLVFQAIKTEESEYRRMRLWHFYSRAEDLEVEFRNVNTKPAYL